jgi:hypothetical protein
MVTGQIFVTWEQEGLDLPAAISTSIRRNRATIRSYSNLFSGMSSSPLGLFSGTPAGHVQPGHASHQGRSMGRGTVNSRFFAFSSL